MTDVLVVGAGPAGTAAAITLARYGRQVTIVDRAVFPRDKCCGDGLTAAALRRVEHLGLDPGRVASWQPVDEVVVVGTSGGRVHLPLRQRQGGLFAVSAKRADLDAALVERARESGAEVIEGQAVTGIGPSAARGGPSAARGGPSAARGGPSAARGGPTAARGGPSAAGAPACTPAGVELQLADGTIRTAPFVVAADGMWSPIRKMLGLTPSGYLGEWQAGRQYLTDVGPEARKLWVWFEPDMVPGYAWSFPLPDGTVNFGYGLFKGSNPDLRGQRIDWRDRPHIADVLGPDARPAGPWRAWPIPARIGQAALSGLGGRVLFAGDAAGACDPMTGEGIAQALETGEAAARAIAQAGAARPHVAAARYARSIRWGMAVDDRLARQLSTVLARRGGSERAVSIVDTSDWARRNFARWMFEDYPRAVLATPHRWHRRMFSRPGAYAHRAGPERPATTSFAPHE